MANVQIYFHKGEITMTVKFATKNFASNSGVKELAEKELKRIEPMFAKDTIFEVCVKKGKNEANKNLYKCDITIKNGKQFVRGYGESNTVQSSIDFAVDSLKRKARKIKTAAIKKRKEYRKFIDDEYDAKPEDSQDMNLSVTRVKQIEANTMSHEEAIMQMELSGHNFFVFKDEDGNVNVLYKRDEGYGVLLAQ